LPPDETVPDAGAGRPGAGARGGRYCSGRVYTRMKAGDGQREADAGAVGAAVHPWGFDGGYMPAVMIHGEFDDFSGMGRSSKRGHRLVRDGQLERTRLQLPRTAHREARHGTDCDAEG